MGDRRLGWGVLIAGVVSCAGAVLVLVDAVRERNAAEGGLQVVALAVGGCLIAYGVVLLRRNGPRRRE